MIAMAEFNLERAHLIIDTLLDQGVTYFCLAPGSRSTPLMLAFSRLLKEQRCVHFDERGLGFHALGFAKASKSPVVIIVTSGTAVANLFPSFIEASLSRVPLVLLSADRPPELRDCGANQTIDQVRLFGSCMQWDIDLPLSDPLCPNEYIISSVAYAVKRSLHGPVQINCMIREPTVPLINRSKAPVVSCVYEPVESTPPLSSFEKWGESLSNYQKGIILLGSGAIQEDPSHILSLAEKLGWPIFSDILSQGRKIGQHPFHMEYPDIFLKTFPQVEIEALLHIGDGFVSKEVATWIKNQKKLDYFQVTNHPFRQDPQHLVSYRMECSEKTFCQTLSPLLARSKDSSWIDFWKKGSTIIREGLIEFFAKNKVFSEPALIHSLQHLSYFFLSNSMPIRNANLFLFPEKGIPFVMANRGASGIDGNIASAIGAACALKKPLAAILGDLATLHDLNSLALWKQSPTPIFFIVINNQGGGIFSFLPIAEKKECFEECVATAHPYSFESAAAMFSLPYFSIDSIENWEPLLDKIIQEQKSCLIECKTKREEIVLHHKTIYQELEAKLCSSTALSETLKIHSSSFSMDSSGLL